MAKVDILDKNGDNIHKSSIFEQLIVIERFYQKNKKKLIFSVLFMVLGVIGYIINNAYIDYQTKQVNLAYYNYKHGINTEENLKFIESNNPKLHSLIIFSEVMAENNAKDLKSFQNSSDGLISDMATYQMASLEKNQEILNSYSYLEKAVYKDFAILSEAYILINEGEFQKAKNRLTFIERNSPLRDFGNYLNHYGILSK